MPAVEGKPTRDEKKFTKERLSKIVSWRIKLLTLIDEGNEDEIKRLAERFLDEQDKKDLLNTRFLFIKEGTDGPGTELTILNYCIGKAHDEESLELYSKISGVLMSQGANAQLKDGMGNKYLACKKVVEEKIKNPEPQQSSNRIDPLSPPESLSTSPEKISSSPLPKKNSSVGFTLGPPGKSGEYDSDDDSPPLDARVAAGFGPEKSQSGNATTSSTVTNESPSAIISTKKSPKEDLGKQLKKVQGQFNSGP